MSIWCLFIRGEHVCSLSLPVAAPLQIAEIDPDILEFCAFFQVHDPNSIECSPLTLSYYFRL